jgi:hypothetical protein
MKTYLNSEERQQVMYLFMSHATTLGILEQNKKNMTKGEITCLKYISTYIEKYFYALVERVGEKEIRRIARESESNMITIKPKHHGGLFTIDKPSLEEVTRRAAKATCVECKIEDWNDCEFYRCMKKLGMGSVDGVPHKCDFYLIKEE